MAISNYLQGDLFRNITETGAQGSRSLFDAYMGNRFGDWGGMFSPQARTLGNYFKHIWSNYLGEKLAASPASGLGRDNMPRMPGRNPQGPMGVQQPATSFADYLRTTDFDQMYGALPPSARGFSGSRFQPMVRRVR